MGVNRKLAVHPGAIDVHFKRDVMLFTSRIMTKPDGRGGSVSKFSNHTVSIVEDMANLYWIVVLRFVAAYCLFFDGVRRLYVDRSGKVCHPGREMARDLGRRQRSAWWTRCSIGGG